MLFIFSLLLLSSISIQANEISQKTSPMTRLRYSSLGYGSGGSTSPLYDAKGLDVESSLYNGAAHRLVQPNTYFVTLVGEKGAEKERSGSGEDKISVMAISHLLSSPRDASSGLATGKRQHNPLILTLPIGISTPRLYNAFISGETFKSVTIGQFIPTNPKQTFNGETTTSPIFSIMLQDAQIAWIEMEGSTMECGITYRTINWKYVDGGIEAIDTWQRP